MKEITILQGKQVIPASQLLHLVSHGTGSARHYAEQKLIS